MARFLIEDDWYLVSDEFSWNIEEKIIAKRRDRISEEFRAKAFCSTLEDALKYYLNMKQLEKAKTAMDGTIYDLIDILTAEKKKIVSIAEITVSTSI